MLKIVDGSKSYLQNGNNITILQPFNLLIEKGEFVAIRGKSGSGKSTLLHVLGCMDQLTTGDYYFNENKLSTNKDNTLAKFRGKHFGFVFQAYHLIREFTALQNVEAPMAYMHIPRKLRRERALALISQVGLEDKTNFYPKQLSGGQQQRVAIARALANQPDVIFADEPTGNLDRENGDKIIALLCELHRQGTTIVMVTHDDDLGKIADRSIHLVDGYIKS